MSDFCPPVLYLIFNRPDLEEISFETIRRARPTKLFIAADGPRENRDDEDISCQQARSIVQKVDWDCQIQTLFRDQNLGCRRAVSEAITWFFEHVDHGIILEDDCVPESAFFPYCAELLHRYQSDVRVMSVTGDNFQDGRRYGNSSYYFSRFMHCWGWATWKRAWQHYDTDLVSLQTRTADRCLSFLRKDQRDYWTDQFQSVKEGRLDTWDFVWLWSSWVHDGLTCTPQVNLVKNIGFDNRATHTRAASSNAHMGTMPLSFPLIHPATVASLEEADRQVANQFVAGQVRGAGILSRLKGALKKRIASLTYGRQEVSGD